MAIFRRALIITSCPTYHQRDLGDFHTRSDETQQLVVVRHLVAIGITAA